MTASLTLLVTGGAGFIGRRVATAALSRGHRVRAIARGRATIGALEVASGAEPVAIDLAEPAAVDALDCALRGVDVVIHTAAALGGDDGRHARDTVEATARLLDAMLRQRGAGTAPALVLASSIAVYDGGRALEGSLVDETTPLEAAPGDRDAYCRAKLAQEELAQRAAVAGLRVWILRLGAVYGPGRLHNAHLGAALGPLLIQVGAGGEVPICGIERCAEAFVLAAERAAAAGGPLLEVVNVLDDDRPDRARFVAALRASGWPRVVAPCGWRAFAALAAAADGAARLVPGLRRRLPGLLRLAVAHARLKPVRYDVSRLRTALAPVPRPSFENAMRTAIGVGPQPAPPRRPSNSVAS